ncbi:DUF6527 family protein [Falsihalocynthiibacter sp. CO-5D18]|uniref:DUF6527 family protein n=1 Tax=Falsihalocynthiibacter sp. CO-5D18 TaxID=3240872 RepID=UPI0035102F2D
MPKQLERAVLYVSAEFETAAHLCACGCGAKVRTPLGPTEWAIRETEAGPTVRPSIGNWQQECRSHYLITRGSVKWAGRWSEEKVLAGRTAEQNRREVYFEENYPEPSISGRFWNWLKSLF